MSGWRLVWFWAAMACAGVHAFFPQSKPLNLSDVCATVMLAAAIIVAGTAPKAGAK